MAEENQTIEGAQIETPKETETPQLTPEQQATEIINELEKSGITNTEQLQGKMDAANQVGNMSQVLGEVRGENQGLKSQIAELQGQMKTLQTAPPQQEYNDYSSGSEHIDLGKIVRDELRGVIRDDYINPQREASARYYADLSEIESDPDFAMVSEIWQKHAQTPAVQSRMSSGQATLKGEYDKVVKTFYRESLKKSVNVLKGLTGQDITIPHVESGNLNVAQTPSATDENARKIKDVVNPEKGFSGSDTDIQKLVNQMLPPEDPIFKR